MKLRTITLFPTKLLPSIFLALFSMHQSANGQSALTCHFAASSAPLIRAEGYAEQVGDITLTCAGGLPPALGSALPRVNLTLTFDEPVTSRLLPINGVSNSAAEPLLLVDEPGSGLPAPIPNFGPGGLESLCKSCHRLFGIRFPDKWRKLRSDGCTSG